MKQTTTITADELKKRLSRNEVVLIDVREKEERDAEYITDSIHIPLAQISAKKLPKDNKPVVIYCHMGKRSAAAVAAIKKDLPSADIVSLEGGLQSWKKEGYQVKSGKMPISRQVTLVAGSLTLLGCLLGMSVSSSFYFIPIFVGCGLIYSSITGWCGTAEILEKMPWNK